MIFYDWKFISRFEYVEDIKRSVIVQWKQHTFFAILIMVKLFEKSQYSTSYIVVIHVDNLIELLSVLWIDSCIEHISKISVPSPETYYLPPNCAHIQQVEMNDSIFSVQRNSVIYLCFVCLSYYHTVAICDKAK